MKKDKYWKSDDGTIPILEDDFDDMADSLGEDIISLDFNSIQPFLMRKCNKRMLIEGNSFKEVINKFKEKLKSSDKNKDLLILVKIREYNNFKYVSTIGWKISELMSDDTLIVWGAKSFSKSPRPERGSERPSHKFMFYFYDWIKYKTNEKEM